MLKLLLLVFCSLFINVTSSNIAVYPTKLGDTLEFDFGRNVKEIEVRRDLGNGIEKLFPSIDGNYLPNKNNKLSTNAFLSNEGLLTINPVTKEDYGTYKSDVLYHPRFAYPVLKIVPLPSAVDVTESEGELNVTEDKKNDLH